MRRACLVMLVCARFVLVIPAGEAAGRAGGLDATITDQFNFKLRLNPLVLKVKPKPGSEREAGALDHLPLVSGGKRATLWLAQVATVTFASKGKNRVEVKAVLQGEGDEVAGVLDDASRHFFEGRIAKGERQGRRARMALTEVTALENHTRYEGRIAGKAGKIIPMPAPNQDVLWVSSVPLGAQVFAKPFDCKAARVWKDYMRIGKTPLMRELGPGKYAIRVLVPAKLAATLRPATKLGEDADPFEHDGWGEVTFRQGENALSSMTYTVIKQEGRAATLIALFQPKDLPLGKVVKGFPAGHNFHFSGKKLEEVLLYHELPKADAALVIEALHRGGKVIWHGEKKSLMIELTPGARGWRIGGAIRPKKKKTDGRQQ